MRLLVVPLLQKKKITHMDLPTKYFTQTKRGTTYITEMVFVTFECQVYIFRDLVLNAFLDIHGEANAQRVRMYLV